ncbi:MAG TPA: winged helix-turn-helix domain-containing protein [Polyangiaceae bacterium]|nr:winged helix-turn-helix domain-containing protein [Polyangiaceae bacterium]
MTKPFDVGELLARIRVALRVAGAGFGERDQYLRVFMRQLRFKLEPEPAQPRYLVTVAGVGYRLRTDS